MVLKQFYYLIKLILIFKDNQLLSTNSLLIQNLLV